MECYRVHIPVGVEVAGVTADGQATHVLPGEYLAHRLSPRLATPAPTVLRFVGANPMGRDVHVPLESLRQLPVTRPA
jgi:hypothetical protein